jgi:flagellar protein FliS
MNARLLDRYKSNNVLTASPAQLLTMLYDRLVLDLTRAEAACIAADHRMCTEQVSHAQEIILELQTSLDPTKWSGGPGLASLYTFVTRELIEANITKDGARINGCRELIEPIRQAWHQAAATLA